MLLPIIKWAGGKRQLLDRIIPMIPDIEGKYYEPFAGGLAVMSYLYSNARIHNATISDLNSELINLYLTVKNNPNNLVEKVKNLGFINSRSFYYKIREEFNAIMGNQEKSIERAAMFLVLNRLCFNGLWRVNSSGKFNVPFGRYSNPRIVSETHILRFSDMLQTVNIMLSDFSVCVRDALDSDFVYFDPPYFPASETARFTEYTSESFGEEDLRRLLDTCRLLDNHNVRFLLSNSYTDTVNEMFGEFHVSKVEARRYINSDAGGRMGHHEVLVYNYDIHESSRFQRF